MKNIFELLNIPVHKNCNNCGECCGVVPASEAEMIQIKNYITVHEISPIKHTDMLICPFRNEREKICEIYAVRPLACRLYGVCAGEFVHCPNGNSANIDGTKFLKNYDFDFGRTLHNFLEL